MSGIFSFLACLFTKFISCFSCNSKPDGESTEIDITVKENNLNSGTAATTQICEERIYWKWQFWK